MNGVPLARRVQIINCLVEGNSIRSTERMTGTHRDTICRLLVEVGGGCAALLDEQMRDLRCRRIEVDEIWAYVGKKQRHMTPLDDPRRVGDQYTVVALDPGSTDLHLFLGEGVSVSPDRHASASALELRSRPKPWLPPSPFAAPSGCAA
jgi:hypothetical protein